MDFGQNQQMYQNNMYQGNGYQNMVAMRNLPRHKIITVNGRQGAGVVNNISTRVIKE